MLEKEHPWICCPPLLQSQKILKSMCDVISKVHAIWFVIISRRVSLGIIFIQTSRHSINWKILSVSHDFLLMGILISLEITIYESWKDFMKE